MHKQKVFISHSSKDSDVAMNLCVHLESNGIPCWIAPRDIEYGEKWAEKIALSLIESTKLFVFLLSENSNNSKQVLKEINIAIENDIPMLIVSINQVEKLNLSLIYYFSNLHIYSCFVNENDDWKNRIVSLINKKMSKTADSKGSDDTHSNKQPVLIGKYNVTDELDAFFSSIPDKEEIDNDVDSSIKERLQSIMARNLIAFWEKNSSEPTDVDEFFQHYDSHNEESEDEQSIKLDPFNVTGIGKSFDLSHKDGLTTLVFRTSFQIDPIKRCRLWYAELVDSFERRMEKDMTVSTYMIFEADKVEQLVIITFDDANKTAFINIGLLEDWSLKITRKPIVMELSAVEKPGKTYRHPVNDDHTYIMIDPDTKELVQPYTVFNEETEENESYVDLVHSKTYFAFNIADDEREPSDFDIGYGYYMGVYGLNKNWFLAAEHLMRTGSMEADYYLGYIFTFDPLLKDAELAAKYIGSAISNGIEEAKLLQ